VLDSTRSRPVALATLVAFSLSCATTQLPPISAAGPEFEPAKDEMRLWEEARAEEATLLEEVPVYDDPLLADYLEGVVERLNPPAMRGREAVRYRVRVIEDPSLNAFAYPHGSLYVHTGLLARMENEHQLATVLAHEMTHVENRHAVRYRRSARNRQIGLSVAALAAAVLIAEEQGDAIGDHDWGKAARIGIFADILVGLGLQLAFLASVNGYGRRLEAEADAGGFDKMEGAGYDLREAPKVYRALLADKGDDPGDLAVFFFGSHPKLTARVDSAEARLATTPGSEGVGAAAAAMPDEVFARRMRPVMRDDARLNVERGRLDLAEEEILGALTALPEDPEAHLVLARLRLAQAAAATDDDEANARRAEARAALEESLRLDPERPAAHRELGLMAYREGDHALACRALERYVATAPAGTEVRVERDYLLELRADGACAD
jgi:predicted Zn-dependent protease